MKIEVSDVAIGQTIKILSREGGLYGGVSLKWRTASVHRVTHKDGWVWLEFLNHSLKCFDPATQVEVVA